ncbi:MAG: anti-sigma factor antagonist [Bacteroidetes bacterium QS_1_65_9]|nr:MAG: anti-sigma factor antagonist [Bacteroidetes bacterium QS_1_65_9]
MRYNVDERYEAVVITLKGDVLGGPEGAELHDRLRELRDEGKNQIVVDLSKAKFMNSGGLGMLVSAMTTARNAGGDLRFANVADRIESLLMVTKLLTVFKEYDSVDEAAQSYETNPPASNGE